MSFKSVKGLQLIISSTDSLSCKRRKRSLANIETNFLAYWPVEPGGVYQQVCSDAGESCPMLL